MRKQGIDGTGMLNLYDRVACTFTRAWRGFGSRCMG